MITHKNHKFTQGDIMSEQVDELVKPFSYDFCYTDPPWGLGNIKYWKTMNNKQNEKVEELKLLTEDELENRVVSLICKGVKSYAFIVYGVKQAESLISKFRNQKTRNIADIQYIEKQYPSGNKWLKNCIICVTFEGNEVFDWKSKLEGTKGLETLRIVLNKMQEKAFKEVLELFVGIGYYTKEFHKKGFNITGNELNKARITKALGKIK